MLDSLDYYKQLAQTIKRLGQSYGFDQVGITDTDVSEHHAHLTTWLEKKFQGSMDYMASRSALRADPSALQEGTQRIITLRMNYLAENTSPQEVLQNKDHAYISRYALGRDYHKLIRNRLKHVAQAIQSELAKNQLEHQYRVFTDSAPVLEKGLAEKSGLGWIGKHTLLINRQAGSWFFLGEIFTDLPLPIDEPTSAHCGSCSACIEICPTRAIVAPYQLDARRCISYLTIENKQTIPVEFRSALGNRVFGCDDCQLVCPWNRYAKSTQEDDFKPRHQLDNVDLLSLFEWSEAKFLKNTEGSAIRRTGYHGWLRNLAVGLGNGSATPAVIQALNNKRQEIDNPMVIEHIDWALAELSSRAGNSFSDQ